MNARQFIHLAARIQHFAIERYGSFSLKTKVSTKKHLLRNDYKIIYQNNNKRRKLEVSTAICVQQKRLYCTRTLIHNNKKKIIFLSTLPMNSHQSSTYFGVHINSTGLNSSNILIMQIVCTERSHTCSLSMSHSIHQSKNQIERVNKICNILILIKSNISIFSTAYRKRIFIERWVGFLFFVFKAPVRFPRTKCVLLPSQIEKHYLGKLGEKHSLKEMSRFGWEERLHAK